MNITNDWREDASSMKDKVKYTLMNENTQQDVVIVAGCGSTETKIKAHSFMLFIGSQVLEKLLEQAKINNEGLKEIRLPDVHPEALKFVLQYIYTDSFDVQYENAMDILYASLKLSLRGLAVLCVAKLKDGLCAANVLRVFEESTKLNFEELVHYSQHFILKNAREVFLQEQFLNITKESLCKLLAFDELEMDETSIFNSILSWGKAECVRSELQETSENLQFVLKRVVPLIRFTLMPIQEFASIVVPTNLLDDKQAIDVYTYLGMKSSASKQAEFPLWISSSSARVISQTENIETVQEQHQHENTKKEKLLQYMKSISGKKTLSGLFFANIEHVNKGVETIHRITSVHPTIVTVHMPSSLHGATRWQSFTEEIISHWNNGYLVHIVWWYRHHPLTQLEMFKTLDYNKWNDLITDDGYLNREWKNQLDNIVPYLKQMQLAGVVVICDICPRINHMRFAWGGRPGMNGSLKLYQITHDYMTQKHNLHSLLWTWSLYIDDDTTNLEEFWPGNEYVDAASIYLVNKEQVEMKLYQKLLEVVGDKPISMEYMYIVPSSELLTLQPRWTWFTAIDIFLENVSYNNNTSINTTFQGLSIVNKENNAFFKILYQ